MRTLRSSAAFLAALVLAACGGSPTDDNLGGNNGGCTSNCGGNNDGGTVDNGGDDQCRDSSHNVVACSYGRACSDTIVVNVSSPSNATMSYMTMDPVKSGETITGGGPYWEKTVNLSGNTSYEMSMAGDGATALLVNATFNGSGLNEDNRYLASGHGSTAHITSSVTAHCGGIIYNCNLTYSPPGGVGKGSAVLCTLN